MMPNGDPLQPPEQIFEEITQRARMQVLSLFGKSKYANDYFRAVLGINKPMQALNRHNGSLTNMRALMLAALTHVGTIRETLSDTRIVSLRSHSA